MFDKEDAQLVLDKGTPRWVVRVDAGCGAGGQGWGRGAGSALKPLPRTLYAMGSSSCAAEPLPPGSFIAARAAATPAEGVWAQQHEHTHAHMMRPTQNPNLDPQVLHYEAAGPRSALPPHHLPRPVHPVPREPDARAPLVRRSL